MPLPVIYQTWGSVSCKLGGSSTWCRNPNYWQTEQHKSPTLVLKWIWLTTEFSLSSEINQNNNK